MGRITEKKHIDIDKECVSNPVYLNWLGTNGGRNYWLFRKVQRKSIITDVIGTFEGYKDDIETAQGFIEDIERSAVPTLTIGAIVPVSKLDGLTKMLYSLNVLMLMNPDTWSSDASGPIWQIVRPIPGTYQLYNTDQITTTFEVTLELPFINIQSQ